MKKIRANMDKYFDRLDNRWRALPMKKQRQYTLYFFLGYLLLTAGVVSKICYDMGKSENHLQIEHIENPVPKKRDRPASLKDSISTILKNKIYERK